MAVYATGKVKEQPAVESRTSDACEYVCILLDAGGLAILTNLAEHKSDRDSER